MARRASRQRPFWAGRGRRARQARMLPVGLPAPLRAVSSPIASGAVRVLGSGDVAFQQIVERVRGADRSVEIRAFLWRDDEAGNMLSFFHKRVDPIRGFQAWFLGAVYRAPGSFKQRPNSLSQQILAHPNIRVEHQRKRFDHSKLYIIDDRTLVLGSMGIGDNHRHDWIDVMVEVEGAEHIARLRERMAGLDEFDPSRGIDFLVHSREAHRKKSCPMISHRLALIDGAEQSLTVEMAYLSDRRFTAALARAVQRGVEVHLVTADQADVLANINRATCDALMRLTGAPDNLTIALVPRMVHSKVVVIDHRFCDIGSANFTPLSHGVYDEINLYVDNEPFARAVEAEIESHCEDSRLVESRLKYRKMVSGLERAIMAYQSRRGG